jgi:hypothetical protein
MEKIPFIPKPFSNLHRDEIVNERIIPHRVEKKYKMDKRRTRWNWLYIQKIMPKLIQQLRERIGY